MDPENVSAFQSKGFGVCMETPKPFFYFPGRYFRPVRGALIFQNLLPYASPGPLEEHPDQIFGQPLELHLVRPAQLDLPAGNQGQEIPQCIQCILGLRKLIPFGRVAQPSFRFLTLCLLLPFFCFYFFLSHG